MPKTRLLSPSLDDARLLLESVSDYAIFMLDAGGHVASWNLGAERIKGYSADEIIGKHFSVFYPPDDVKAGKAADELRVAAEVGRVEDEGWRVRKDGERFWANVVITALRTPDGVLHGFAKVTKDLTRRREVEEELRRSEQRFHLLVDAVADYAIYMLDPHGHVATWNAGARRIKGYEEHEIIGKHFSAFYTPEDRAAGRPEQILATVRKHGRYEEESWRCRKDGTPFWANVVITALRDERGKVFGFAKVTRDLSERKIAARVTEEATEAARIAEEGNRIKDEFLATVSHELRTPLTAMLGWSSLLRQRTEDPALLKGLDIIHRNAQAQAKIVEDILDVSRIITGKLRLELKPADLKAVTRDALHVVRPSAKAKGIRLVFKVPKGPCPLLADPERLQQVAWNLLSNAVKFTPKGGKITVRLRRETSTKRLVLSVVDTGDGIEPEFLPFVFDRFKQADGSTTRRIGGLGLGLSIVRHIVELHGGLVNAFSAGKGRGSTFEIRLPERAVVPAVHKTNSIPATPPAAPAAALVAAPSLSGVRILVVDDDADARELIETLLRSWGAHVKTARSASEAFKLVQRVRPHVLVSDIAMPDEDGYGLMRRIRALAPAKGGGIPSVALTAHARAEDRTKALSVGFTTHIGKPVRPDDLLSTVVNLARFSPRPESDRRPARASRR